MCRSKKALFFVPILLFFCITFMPFSSFTEEINEYFDNIIGSFLLEIQNKKSIKSQDIENLTIDKNYDGQYDLSNFFNSAEMLILNKITTKIDKVTLISDSVNHIKNLEIELYGCWFFKENPEKGHMALLKIRESNNKENFFNGWMLSKFYFISSMKHKIYDMRLLSCGGL